MDFLKVIPPITIKFDLYLVKYDFKVVFDGQFYPHIRSDLHKKTTIFHLKGLLLPWIEVYIERGYKISHTFEIILRLQALKNTWFIIFILKNRYKLLN